ncbi:MAG: type II toxin-antitoxin system RelE/ParE family toxin [Armatimonadota bacterium]|nr:type II toxin-antitoxin system RelE/ParE family toxin [Armatimonadota bacterium]
MASRRVRVTPQAERDIDSEVVYLAGEADAETAIRFFDAAHETFRALLDTPGMGRARPVGNPRVADIRQWAVSGFGKYLIFYRIVPSGVDIIRVLHGARDIDQLLEEETFPA